MPSRHAVLAPSASKRWMTCTPSARLEAMEPERAETAFAREGTLAHGLAEFLLNELNDGHLSFEELDSYKDSDTFGECLSAIEREGYDVDAMWDYVVNGYVRPVFGRFLDLREIVDGDARLLVEAELQLDAYIPESFGSVDSCIVAGRVMYVNDLKYGRGVAVEAEWNSQMMCYALGAYTALKPFIEEVEMTIYQPRLGKPVSWRVRLTDLMTWAETVLKPQAVQAFQGLGRLVAGDHCQFCKIKAHCPEQQALTTYVDDRSASLDRLSPEDVAQLLPLVPVARQHLDALEAYATTTILNGGTIPGYKVVEGRSVRKIADPKAAYAALVEANFEPAMILKEPELKSIGDLEKMMGKAGKSILAPFIEKPQGKPTLAPESDRRPAITNTKELFAELNNLLDK